MFNDSDKILMEKMLALFDKDPDARGAFAAFVELLEEKHELESSAISPMQEKSRPGWIPVLGRTAAGLAGFWPDGEVPDPAQAVVELDELVEKYTGKAISSQPGRLSVDLEAGHTAGKIKGAEANLVQVAYEPGDYGTDQPVQFIDCASVNKIFPDAFALQVDGDSMSPRINDTDIVILSPSVPAGQGQIAVAHLAGQIGASCKLIRTSETDVHLIPINERYDAKTYPKEKLLWALAVICHVKV